MSISTGDIYKTHLKCGPCRPALQRKAKFPVNQETFTDPRDALSILKYADPVSIQSILSTRSKRSERASVQISVSSWRAARLTVRNATRDPVMMLLLLLRVCHVKESSCGASDGDIRDPRARAWIQTNCDSFPCPIGAWKRAAFCLQSATRCVSTQVNGVIHADQVRSTQSTDPLARTFNAFEARA